MKDKSFTFVCVLLISIFALQGLTIGDNSGTNVEGKELTLLNEKNSGSIDRFTAFPVSLDFLISEPSLTEGDDFLSFSNIVITKDDDFVTYGFAGEGTKLSPYLIENYTLTGGTKGIDIRNTTKHFIIRNCTILSVVTSSSVYLYNVADGTATITNNTLQYHELYGIQLVVVNNCTVSENIITGGTYGIYVENSLYNSFFNNVISNCRDVGIYTQESDYSLIKYNIAINSQWGIYSAYSNYVDIINNTITNHTLMGLGLFACDFSTLVNNTIKNNDIGVGIEWSEDVVCSHNFIKNNTDYGLKVYISANVMIYLNSFVENIGNSSQGYDDSEDNFWYNSLTEEGNYWSDYTGIGSYSIDGDGEAVDLYPTGPALVSEFALGFFLVIPVFFAFLFAIPHIRGRKRS